MPDEKSVRVRLSKKTAKIFKEYCREKNINMKKFIEEAIMEKLEYEEIRDDMFLYDYADFSEPRQADSWDVVADVPETDTKKNRH